MTIAEISTPRTAAPDFVAELEHFRKQAEGAVQFLSAHLAVNNAVVRDPAIRSALNVSALYWLTSQAALQQSAIISLGRIFDQESDHNIDKLIALAQDGRESVFSKTALRARKRGNQSPDPVWLDEFMVDVYEPTAHDFREIRKEVKKWRDVYVAKYRPLRNSFLAHSETIEPGEIDALHAATNIGELQALMSFLCGLHDALRDLFQNGTKLDLTGQRQNDLSARVTAEAEAMLAQLVK